ncbi:hypothetical protein SUGI_0538790 [Cryptomeria japonica]|nr:hypothetical protein SUGI_0538790 [Cryptomeria japonica]
MNLGVSNDCPLTSTPARKALSDLRGCGAQGAGEDLGDCMEVAECKSSYVQEMNNKIFDNDKKLSSVIVPYNKDPNQELLTEAIKAYGTQKAINKKVKKKKKERKGRAEEEADQARAKSSSRHEMQGPARVHLTDEEKKRRDVPYDLIPRSQLSFQYLI